MSTIDQENTVYLSHCSLPYHGQSPEGRTRAPGMSSSEILSQCKVTRFYCHITYNYALCKMHSKKRKGRIHDETARV